MLISGGKVLAIDELLIDLGSLSGDGIFKPLGVVGFLTEEQADMKYQPKGDYVKGDYLYNNYYNKNFINANYNTKDEVYTRDYINSFFQAKGDYALKSDIDAVNSFIAYNFYTTGQIDAKIKDFVTKSYVDDNITAVNKKHDDDVVILNNAITAGDAAVDARLASHIIDAVPHLSQTEHQQLTTLLDTDFSKYLLTPSLDDGYYTLHSMNGVNTWEKARTVTGENGLSSVYNGFDGSYHVGLSTATTATLNRVNTSAVVWDTVTSKQDILDPEIFEKIEKIDNFTDVKFTNTTAAESLAKNTVYFYVEEIDE